MSADFKCEGCGSPVNEDEAHWMVLDAGSWWEQSDPYHPDCYPKAPSLQAYRQLHLT